MTKTLSIAALAAPLLALAAPASAAFYYEGLLPYTQAPNCTDPYATECGRYGAVPHDDHATPQLPRMKRDTPPPRVAPDRPTRRYKTREGLEK
ncbi:MAG: hypothetical protein CMO01_00405 [Thalassobius sp.]|nr:hypothetical protein [Thalassovita sp.]